MIRMLWGITPSETQHSTPHHSTGVTQHSTAQQSIAQHRTTQRSTAQNNTEQHRTTQHSTARNSTAQRNRTESQANCAELNSGRTAGGAQTIIINY